MPPPSPAASMPEPATLRVCDDDEEVVVGSREQLLHLLAEAAEIEHSLMCSYLYAAFSLRTEEEDGLDEPRRAVVRRWRDAIMDVAVQEMGHLLMVANLTVAVGGRPHFSRPNFPISTGYFPAAVVVRLTGFSRETLDHFIHLERPRGVAGQDDPAFEQEDYQREQIHLGLMPSTQDYATIGHLYEAIRANLVHLAEHLGEEALFIGARGRQIGRALVDLPGVDEVGSLAEACAALDMIIEQGEGSPADRADSHYQAFSAIGGELARLSAADPGYRPAWPVASNPVLRRPPEPEDKIFIDDAAAAELLDFGCATYGLLLRLLVQSFGREGAGQQAALVNGAIELMHVLGAAGRALARMPASLSAPGIHAGLSFTMLRGIEPLLQPSEGPVLAEQIMALLRAARRIASLPEAVRGTLAGLAAKLPAELRALPEGAVAGG